MNKNKAKLGLMLASFQMMSTLVPTSVLADIASSFPDVPAQTVQMILSIPSLSGIIVALIAGQLTRWFYKKHLIIAGSALFLIGGPLPRFFPDSGIELVLFSAGLLGMGMGIMITCVASLICDCFEGTERSVLMGLQSAFISGGGMVFAYLGGVFGSLDWRGSFLAYFFIAPILIAEIFLLPKGKLDAKPLSAHTARLPMSVWYYSIFGFSFFLASTVYQANVSMRVTEAGFGGTDQSSVASMCYTFAGIVAGCFVGLAVRKLGKHVICLSAMLGCTGMTVCMLSQTLWHLCLGGLLVGTGFALFTPSGNLFSAESCDVTSRTASIALFSSLSNLGMAVSPVAIAWIVMGEGSLNRYFFSACLFAILTVVAFTVNKKLSI